MEVATTYPRLFQPEEEMFTATFSPVKFTPDEKIQYELGLLNRMSEGDLRACVLYYREKLADVVKCDKTPPVMATTSTTPREIATNLLNMRECPVSDGEGRLLRLIKEKSVALAAAQAELVELREELCGATETNDAAKALIKQAELTADAIEASEDGECRDVDRLAYLEQKELIDAVALYREQREAWDDAADDDDDTELFLGDDE